MRENTSILTTQPPVYGTAEAARALQISASYVRKLYVAGVARPSVPLGGTGRKLYSHADLENLAAAIGRDIDHGPQKEAACWP